MSAQANSTAEVSVIIVNWNSKAYVRQCLASMFRHCEKESLEVVVVDGGSFDGCDEMLRIEYPQVKFVQSRENVGFARANNLGVLHATGRFLFFLNPDTEFLENSIRTLKARLASVPEAGAVGCKLLNADRTLQTSCVQSFPTVINQLLDSDFLRRRFPHWRMWGIRPLIADDLKPTEVEVICGADLLVKRDVFERIGGFTERYFMYGEDLDLCFKIRQAGHRVYYVPETSIIHYGGGSTQTSSSNFSNVMMRESVYRFLRMNRGRSSALLYRTAMAVSSVVRTVLAIPLLLVSGKRIVTDGPGSLRKWLAILRWSVGFKTAIIPRN